MSLIRGDLEMGATGTVTHVDGSRVYAFGHPFLNLGPTSFAMTRARVVHRAAESRLLDEDRDARSGDRHDDAGSRDRGRRHARRRRRASSRSTSRSRRRARPSGGCTFYVLRDQTLTPLFTYVAVLNALVCVRAADRRAHDRGDTAPSRSARTARSRSTTSSPATRPSRSRRPASRRRRGGRDQRVPRDACREARRHAPRRRAAGQHDDRARVARHDETGAWRHAHAAGAAARLPRRHRDHLDAGRHAGAGERAADAARERCRHARWHSSSATSSRASRPPGRRCSRR